MKKIEKPQFKKGHIPWNKGKEMSKEYKKKMSDAQKGKKLSKEHKNNIGEAMKGRKFSKEWRSKISESHKGLPGTNKGKKFSKITKKKMSDAQKGSLAYNWKGGITPKNNKIRASVESRLWRESVFARDGWTCQKCNKIGGTLCAHHILNFAQYPELRFAIDNGVILCEQCHKKFHKKYGKKDNNKKQLDEFTTKL